MSYSGFRFTGRFASLIRPPDRPAAVEGNTWATDKVGGVGGTELDATWANRFKANFENLVARLRGNPHAGDNQLADAIEGALATKSDADHDHDERYYPQDVADILLALLQPIAERGIANGYAELDAAGKVPIAQLPASVLGDVTFGDLWNASTNAPVLESGAGTKGTYYIVSTAGSTNLDGITDWQVGDWAIFNGITWGKVDNTDAVSSVAGLTGVIGGAALKSALAITTADITNASANGRSLIQAANYAAMKTLLAIGTGDVSGLGTAATRNVGTAANNVPALDGSGRLPAVNASLLTNLPTAHLPRGHIAGLILSNAIADPTNDITVSVGSCRSDNDADDIELTAAITKRLDAAWAVGSGNGGLDTGSIANGTYHIWLIKRPDTGVVDMMFSASATAPTMPANYSRKRRIGSIIRAGVIYAFVQVGDHFEHKNIVLDVNTSGISTTPINYALTVPSGIVVEAEINFWGYTGATAVAFNIYSPDRLDQSADATLGRTISTGVQAIGGIGSGRIRVRTNTSGQIRTVASHALTSFVVGTMGWYDTRGRDA